jgi:hypothetical protein
MNIKKGFISFVVIASLILSCSIAAAESLSDPSGDVYHWKSTGSGFQWEASVDAKPNIDITELSIETDGGKLTLKLEVAGSIQSSEKITYIAWVNVSDSYYYWLSWTNGQGAGFAVNTEEGSGQFDYEPDVIASGDTLTATFDIVGSDPSTSNVWGWAAEYTQLNDITNEWWGDWIPGEYAPFYGDINGDDDTSGDDTSNDDTGDDSSTDGNNNDDSSGDSSTGTPGFESIILFTAFIALIFFMRRKREI